MKKIILDDKSWSFDESNPLGSPGGFGAVFLGASENGEPVAVKRLHVESQGHAVRELEIADFLTGHDKPHIIPIYAAGKDTSSNQLFIVMARAQQSLGDLIQSAAPISEIEALEIVSAIASGLAEIGELVHRDLKPANVLLHNGIWKLADLGLARFVEASTSLNTMKDFLSAQYAAPEQWKGERVTKKTDVYALGCILYTLLLGRPPFGGPTQADYSQQHQFAAPPALEVSPRLQRLALTCLSKSHELRPSVASLRTQIERIKALSVGNSKNPIANAAAILAEREARKEANDLERRKVEEDRTAAAQESVKQFLKMMEDVLNLIFEEAPNAKLLKPGGLLVDGTHPLRRGVELGDGYLRFDIPYPLVQPGAVKKNWDILAGGMIEVASRWMSGGPISGRSANLWFGKIKKNDSYRWWEVAYMHNPAVEKAGSFQTHRHPMAPFSIGEGHSWTGYRFGLNFLRLGDYELAYNPKPIDGEYFDGFCARWSKLLAEVALRELVPPKVLPMEKIRR